MDYILQVDHLDLRIPQRQLFKDLSFGIPQGALTCITGENGVGKTTLIKYLLRHINRESATVTINLTPDQVQYVPQLRNIDDDYPLSVADFVALGFKHRLLPWNTPRMKQTVADLLHETNLTKIARQPLGKASGGEKQRAYLAQALCAEPQLLIMDEATANLDQESKHELLRLLKRIMPQRNLTVIFITHDPELITTYADYELHLANQTGHLTKKEAQH